MGPVTYYDNYVEATHVHAYTASLVRTDTAKVSFDFAHLQASY